MRRFKLINSIGNEYDLTSEKVLFHNVSGLGVSKSNTYRQVGHRFNLSYVSPDQVDINGAIAFYGLNPYADYFEFASFIASGGLTILYTVNDNDWYQKDVDLKNLDKGEINQNGYLDCPIALSPKTPWYKKIGVSTSNVIEKVENPSIFPWVWTKDGDKSIGITFGTSDGLFVDINSYSLIESPMRIEITGPIENPHWTQSVNGKRYSEGAVNVDIGDKEKLVISNIGETYEMSVYSLDGTFVKDAYKDSDFTKERFIWLQPGKNTISVDGISTGTGVSLKTEAYVYYETV